LQTSEQVDDVLLVPGERSELLFTPEGEAGAQLTLRALPHERFVCGGCGTTEDLMTFRLMPGTGITKQAPLRLAVIEAIDTRAAREQNLVLSETTHNGETALAINDHVHGVDPLMLHATVGQTEVWTIENETDYDHPFHLHGFRFQVLEQNGRNPSSRAWKDTVNVVAGQRVRFAVSYDDRPGMWMFHCHILSHAELGMMGMLHLER
jgi:FtsP/CotA-like multicopper oxidase with cupredoxin domain